MPRFLCPEKLDPLFTKKKRYKLIIGGRGGAKSQTVGDGNLQDSQVDGLKICYFREFQNSIEDSVKSLLDSEIQRLKLEGFRSTNTEISNSSGGLIRFRGLARNLFSIQSMAGFDRFVIEEAQFLTTESIKVLTPTLREDDSEIWLLANPQSAADPFSVRFLVPFQKYIDRDGYYEDDDHLIIVINYYDNPFFPAVLEKERQFDKKFLSVPEYEHKWLGKYNDTVPGSIIPVAWFNSAIDLHLKLGIKPLGARIVTFDPSDVGPDQKGLCDRHGSIILDALEMDTGDAADGADWATTYAIDNHADVFRWDCDGLGVSLKLQISNALEGKRCEIDMFKGSETPDFPDAIYQPENRVDPRVAKTNRQTFRNKRAQYYFMLRDRFRSSYEAATKGFYINPEDLICLNGQMPLLGQLRTETCRIPKKLNANGMLQIMSKDDMKRLTPPIKSPNLADSLMMSMKAHVSPLQRQSSAAKPIRRTSARGWT